MQVRPVTAADATAWIALRHALWPDADAAVLADEALAFLSGATPPAMLAAVFVAAASDGAFLGMIELSLRPYADGCDSSPVPYIEGWYVIEGHRGRGIGAALVRAAENWAREHGHTEMASDAVLDNVVSERAHKALGFTEVERAIRFRKQLAR
ncbi:MAG TPA: GNAT family N-acetyltransferase [Alphaproteobacteria bacterium]|nr:GNAT family N-acetyltransferase [Alphaproteobacteria bacterium]